MKKNNTKIKTHFLFGKITGVNMKMKLTEEGVKALHEILTSKLDQFDPFSKDAP